MTERCFYILNGNNGSTYVINVRSFKSIRYSLEFYKAINIKAVIASEILAYWLCILGFLKVAKLKSKRQIEAYLANEINKKIDFKLDNKCSLFISTTRDKIIVNHHENYFQKFSFGNSYNNVKNEIKIYGLLYSLKEFTISEIFDAKDKGVYCSFKLKHPKLFKKNNITPSSRFLSKILLEFFNKSSKEFVTWNSYVLSLKDKLDKSYVFERNIIHKINNIANKNIKLKLGLVHRDFKPWNMLYGYPPLIYDFEETIINGPPLEDFFNFYIDPIIRYQAPREILQLINSKEIKKAAEHYINELGLEISLEYLLITYCLERMLFWESKMDVKTAKCYKKLLLDIK